MYELLYIEGLPRPYFLVGPLPQHPARVVFTLKQKDGSFALEVLERLNSPEDVSEAA